MGSKCKTCGLTERGHHPCDEAGTLHPCPDEFHRDMNIVKCQQSGCTANGLTRKRRWWCAIHHPEHPMNATPTPPGAAPDAASGPKAPPRMPAPADARPMVVGGAFVKFDRPAPAPDAGAAEDHPTAASFAARRDHGAEGSDRAVVEAARAKLMESVRVLCVKREEGVSALALGGYVDLVWDAYAAYLRDAALRGTNQGDQPKAGHEAEGREGA